MKRITAAKSSDVRENQVFATKIDGHSLLLSRIKGQVVAIENKCPHLGLSLTRGKIANGTITCPFHGSKFDLCSGRNLDWANAVLGLKMPAWSHGLLAMGRKPADLARYETREEGGSVIVNLPG